MKKKVAVFMLVVIAVIAFSACSPENEKGGNSNGKEEEEVPVVSYYHDTEDMAFIKDMKLVENSEFDKPTLEENGWQLRGDKWERRAGWWSGDMVSIADGVLNIDVAYYKDGLPGVYKYYTVDDDGKTVTEETESPAGFYAAGIRSKRSDYKFGFYEIRMNVCMPTGAWSAFWLTAPDLYKPTGVTGA